MSNNNLSNDYSLLSKETTSFLSEEKKMYINGRWTLAQSGGTFETYDPTTSQVISVVPAASSEDVDIAVKAARKAFDEGPWPRLAPADRERRILKLADLLEMQGNVFSEIESVNSGRTLMVTKLFDVDLSVDCLRYMGGWSTKIEGRTMNPSVPYAAGAKFFSYSTREPLGVVAGITPWNVPLGQAIWKIAPALAAGCTIVLKPAEQTSLTALKFATLLETADIPPGVVNIITGPGITTGAALVNHPQIDKISFTGSTQVGKEIGPIAAKNMKKVTLELGGKSPVMIFEDADLDIAIPGAAWAIYGNHGQNCCAGSRLFVHEKIFDKVVNGVAEVAKTFNLGSALDPATMMGPLISLKQQERVLSYIESGVADGSEVLTGGKRPEHPGSFVEPTVLVNTNDSMKCVKEEIFGPVLVAMPFKDEAEVVKRANDTNFGLGASIWTTNLNTAYRVSPQIKAGTIWVNTHNVLDIAVPFGGEKDSGVGHELSEEAVLQNTTMKVHTIALS